MAARSLQEISDTVVRRAQRVGYVLPRDIRSELKLAGLPDSQWKDVVSLARESLNLRQGRYYHVSALSPRLEQERMRQRLIQRAVRRLVRAHRAAGSPNERRQQDRIDFVQPVSVHLEDGRQFVLLSRDLSLTGIRLVGTRRLLGQKVRVHIPQGENSTPVAFLVRILWTCAIGDDLFENGGTFLEILGD
jgi:hypothetical protein